MVVWVFWGMIRCSTQLPPIIQISCIARDRSKCLKQWHRCNAKGRPLWKNNGATGGTLPKWFDFGNRWRRLKPTFPTVTGSSRRFVLPQLAMLSMLLTALASKIHSWSPPAQRCNVSSQVNLGEINSTKRWRKKASKDIYSLAHSSRHKCVTDIYFPRNQRWIHENMEISPQIVAFWNSNKS